TIDDAADRLLVAGNRPRRKHHAVTARQRDLWVLVLGDTGERCARFALAAGAQTHHLVRWQMAVDVDAVKRLHTIEVSGLAGHRDHAIHGAAGHHPLPLRLARGLA